MAQRYGGKFSPDPPAQDDQPAKRNPWRGKRRTRAGGRVNLLFLAPLPLVVRAFFQEPTGLALDLAACGLLILAACLGLATACRFFERCPRRMDRCESQNPERFDVGPNGHQAACFLYEGRVSASGEA